MFNTFYFDQITQKNLTSSNYKNHLDNKRYTAIEIFLALAVSI